MDLKPDVEKEKMQLNLTKIQRVGIFRRGKQEEKHNRVKTLLDYKKIAWERGRISGLRFSLSEK